MEEIDPRDPAEARHFHSARKQPAIYRAVDLGEHLGEPIPCRAADEWMSFCEPEKVANAYSDLDQV